MGAATTIEACATCGNCTNDPAAAGWVRDEYGAWWCCEQCIEDFKEAEARDAERERKRKENSEKWLHGSERIQKARESPEGREALRKFHQASERRAPASETRALWRAYLKLLKPAACGGKRRLAGPA
jgi:hypothetical protein